MLIDFKIAYFAESFTLFEYFFTSILLCYKLQGLGYDRVIFNIALKNYV